MSDSKLRAVVLGKGDHAVYVHPKYPGHITVAGNDGDDAQRYDEDNLRVAKRVLGVK